MHGGGPLNMGPPGLNVAGGGLLAPSWQGVNGSIDEVAVYPTSLTPAQVKNHLLAAGVLAAAPGSVTATAGDPSQPNQVTVPRTPAPPPGAYPGTHYLST